MGSPKAKLQELYRAALRHHQAGRLPEAKAMYEKVLASVPDHAHANHLLGVIEHHLGNHDLAERLITRAVRANPREFTFYNNLGVILQDQGRLAEAVEICRRGLSLAPDNVVGLLNLGKYLRKLGRFAEAGGCFDKVIALDPDNAEAHNGLGKVLLDLGGLNQAVASLRKALAIKPDYAEAYANLGTVFLQLGQADDAIEYLQRALAVNPGLAGVHADLLCALLYHPEVSQEAIYQEARKWDRRHAGPLKAKQRPHANSRDKNRRLRIGYVSPDFRFHSVNAFFEPLLTAHDREHFDIYLYANVAKPDVVTKRLETEADHWTSIVNMGDDEAAERIRADRIDILVDLAKYSADNRLLLFARKPAPVQVTWLGYPCTTGMEAMDYRIVDAVTHPAGKTDSLNSETLVRLAQGYFCFEPRDNVPDVAPCPAAVCGHITFGSFNNRLKINDGMLAAWSEIMSRVAGSRLVMLGKGFSEKPVRQHFSALFAGHGINMERVKLLPPLPYREYLTMYGEVDIALDPFPYNGHTTTCDSLWMGVPVVTLQGEADCSRVGASILTRIGLPWLIAASRQEYVDKVVELAGDPLRLAGLRSSMRERVRNSSLCDVRGFARSMEEAYAGMWRTWCDSAA